MPEPIRNTIRDGGAEHPFFASDAGNRRSTGPPTEAHEDLFTGPQQHVDAERGSPLRLTMPTEADTCRKLVVPKLQAAGWAAKENYDTENPCINNEPLNEIAK